MGLGERAVVLVFVAIALMVSACSSDSDTGTTGDDEGTGDPESVSALLTAELPMADSAIPPSQEADPTTLITTSPQQYCQQAVGAAGHVQPSGHSEDFWCVWDDGRREKLDHDEGCRWASGNDGGFTRVVDPWQPWLSRCHIPA